MRLRGCLLWGALLSLAVLAFFLPRLLQPQNLAEAEHTTATIPPTAPPKLVSFLLLLMDDLHLGEQAHPRALGALTVYRDVQPMQVAIGWLPAAQWPHLNAWLTPEGLPSPSLVAQLPPHLQFYFVVDEIALRDLVNEIGGLTINGTLYDGPAFYAWVFSPNLGEAERQQRLTCGLQLILQHDPSNLAQHLLTWLARYRGGRINHNLPPDLLETGLTQANTQGIGLLGDPLVCDKALGAPGNCGTLSPCPTTAP